MKLKIKKLKEDAKIPVRGSDYAAGYDLFANNSKATSWNTIVIPAHSTVPVGTGIAVAIPEGYFGALYARSGLSIRDGLRPGNCVGVIDSDYRGEIIVGLHNDSDENRTVDIGDRIAQLVIQKFEPVEFEEVESLTKTERGEDGLGSTGTK